MRKKWLILNDFDFNVAKTQILDRRAPPLEYDEFLQRILNDNPNEIIDTFATIRRPRLIKTHLPVHLLPDEVWTVKPKIIHVNVMSKMLLYLTITSSNQILLSLPFKNISSTS